MIGLYMDVHIPRAITIGLRTRSVDVITAQEEHCAFLPDPALLDRASELGRALFSCDEDLLIEGQRRQTEGIYFAGVIYIHLLRISIGKCIEDLEFLSLVANKEDLEN
jgi:hypothetical protein